LSFTHHAAPPVYYVPSTAQLPAQLPISLPSWPISGTTVDVNIEEDMEEQEEHPSSRVSFDSLCYGENDPFMPEPPMPEGLFSMSMEGQHPEQMSATEIELWLLSHPNAPSAIASNPISAGNTWPISPSSSGNPHLLVQRRASL
jgi:hypothetical protein